MFFDLRAESINVSERCNLWVRTCLSTRNSEIKKGTGEAVGGGCSITNHIKQEESTSIAYCSAGKPNASQPIGCNTLKPCIRLSLARISVAV